MSATMKSGAGDDLLTIGTNKAARAELFDANGSRLGITGAPLVVRLDKNPARLGRYRAASFRTLGAAAATQNLLTIENPTGSGKVLNVKRVFVTADSTALLATVAPTVRLSRAGGLPSGGSLLNAVKHNTALDAAPVAVIRGGTASDGGGATAITATAGDTIAQQMINRLHTAAGIMVTSEQVLFANNDPGDELVLQPGEALLVQIVVAAAATTFFLATVGWEEFTA